MKQDGHRGTDPQPRRRRGFAGPLGVSLVLVALVLLVGVGLYYGYGARARSQLDRLNYIVEDASLAPLAMGPVALVVAQPSSFGTQPASGQAPSAVIAAHPDAASGPGPGNRTSSDYLPLAYAAAYPGAQMHPKYWGHPMWAGSDRFTYRESGLPEGFRLVSESDIITSPGTAGNASRIRIPVIEVDSAVEELAILKMADSRTYETPNNVVGHIPQTPNPAEPGTGWYFGHLESPIKGEGNVFGKLPEIPDHLRNGDPVYVTIQGQGGELLYQVTRTQVMPQDALQLHDLGGSTIILVACVPRLVYDHRLLVTAKLVGVSS